MHLNGQHPSTAVLFAQHAPGGRPDATAAELTAADDEPRTHPAVPEEQVVLRLLVADGPDVRVRIGALLKATRAGLFDDVPLTSLELHMDGGGRGRHGPGHR